MNLDEAQRELDRRIYRTTIGWFEALEHNGAVSGNGHHMAQELQSHGRAILERHWRGT